MGTKSVSALVLGALFATVSFAQNINGSIAGRVVDQQGAVVPNVSVTAIDAAQQSRISTKTNGHP